MKAFLTTTAILAAITFAAPSCFAASTPGELASYNLPIGASTLKAGHAVRPVYSESFQKAVQSVIEKLSAMPEDKKDKRDAFIANFDLAVLPAFDADIWENQQAYEAYRAGLRETQVEPVQVVAVSLQSLGNDEWRLNSVTVDQNQRSAPLTIGALRYNARSNTWVSNNGELRANPYTTTEDCAYGAQTGTEWRLEKQDEMSQVTEFVRFTKTADGQYIYIVYSFQEKSTISGTVLANGGYTLRFPAK